MEKPVQNVRLAIQYALNTEQGKKELDKCSYHDGRTGKMVHKNPSMAQAMQLAALNQADNNRLMINHNAKILPEFKRPKGKVTRNHPLEEYSWLRKRK